MIKNNILDYVGAILFLFLLMIAQGSNGQDTLNSMKDPEAFRKNMLESSAHITNISSDFIQLKHLSFLEEEVESQGVFYFQKENKLRWEYNDPFFYLIIFNGDNILIQDDNKTNVYDAASGRLFKEINNIMITLVDGSILESDNFQISYFEKPGKYILELIPKDENMKEFLARILIYIEPVNYTADELFMIERSDDYTQIRFINKQLNEDIPQHIFDIP